MDDVTLNLQNELTPTLEQRLLPRLEVREELSARITELEGHKKALNDEISSALLAEGKDKAKVGEYSLAFTARERRSIDPAALKFALVERGVSTDVIEAAIGKAEKVSSYTQLDVRRSKPR